MKIILFNQNPMITKLLESVSKKLELSMEDFNRYQELSTRLKEDPEWILIADDECLEKLDQVDWLELKEIISQNKNSVCMYKKGNEAQPFLEGFEMKIKKPFLPTEVLKVLQKKLGSNASELEPSQNLDPAQEVLETNWDELENLGDLKALVQEEPNNEEQLLPTLNNQKEKEEVKEEEKEEVKEEEKEEIKEEEKEEIKETPQEEEKPKDDEIQEGETLKDEEVSKELETQEELEIPKEETQEQVKEQEPIKEETQENKEEKQEKTQEEVKEETQEEVKEETQEEVKEETQEEVKEETQEIKEKKQEKTQDSPSVQELEAMQELVKEIQENSNGQEDKKETQESTETPQDVEIPQAQEKETQELEIPKEEIQEETQENAETPQESAETPQEKETQELEIPKEEIQENTETPQKLETQKDHYESIEDIPEPVMAQAMGEELPFLNEAVAKIPNNENDTETPKESVIKTPQEKEESDKTSNPLELRLNLQDLLKSLNQESLKSLLENKTLSIKITLEDKKPDA
ncbi:chemotaxis regulatory protein ChePep [Helicobacter pylori]